jgi:hypothetical protein
MDHIQKENSSESSLSSEFFILDVELAHGEGKGLRRNPAWITKSV